MVVYSDKFKVYRLYDKETENLIISHDVYFVEPNEKQVAEKQQIDLQLLSR